MLRTERLVLREWRESDLAPFAEMGSDPRVMEHFPKQLSRAESDVLVGLLQGHFAQHGFGLWAVEAPGVSDFVGFLGLSRPHFEAHFTPCVEVGWRLAQAHWGRGYATEAGRAALGFAFGELGLDEVVSFTVPANVRSRAVMERLGLVRDIAGDFAHPRVPEGHALREHVLYRIGRAAYEKGAK